MGSGPSFGRRNAELRLADDAWKEAQRKADDLKIKYWNMRLEQGEPLRPSPSLGAALNAGYTHLRVHCAGCKTRALVPLTSIRRRPETALWKLEGSFACQRCSERAPFPPKARIEKVVRS
jgi:hypothetical protein